MVISPEYDNISTIMIRISKCTQTSNANPHPSALPFVDVVNRKAFIFLVFSKNNNHVPTLNKYTLGAERWSRLAPKVVSIHSRNAGRTTPLNLYLRNNWETFTSNFQNRQKRNPMQWYTQQMCVEQSPWTNICDQQKIFFTSEQLLPFELLTRASSI